MERRHIKIILLPIVIGMALFLIMSVIDLDLRFTPVEMSVFHYRYDMPNSFNIKDILSDNKSVVLTSLENPFTKKVSVDNNIESPKPEPKIDEIIIKSIEPISLKVSLIVRGNGKNIAIVNGKILREGDVIKGFKVDKIEDQKVLLLSKDKSYWIRVDDNQE
ncbi:MAG: hypothetical protein HQK93_02735 [Nitrospirae bacterium]|nr:hypothetical protein [Nitrospirota bacterium]